MGMQQSTYFAYGFRIPDTDNDTLKEALKGQPENARVGFCHGGDYDRDMTFLVTEFHDVDLGDFKVITPESFERYEIPAWNAALHAAALKLGHPDHPQPGWLLIPDVS
ncbi:hypothetical protein [Streptomyces sp. NBRC 110035]|uniref:hypothetical protein n=1 Tax=Streptomyces sp. NBRC 110035 TaxID=1547867 RepID=UPI0005A617AC|nr:hypothetical protein [Streptomyces sp. NBRC 110035]